MQQLTTAQIENILLDTGVVYLDYGLAGERILAPTRGGNSFVVEQDVKIIERDGSLGKEKGLRRVIKEDATLTVKLLDVSIANLQMALAGATATSTVITSTVTGLIASTEYFTNITLVGTDLEGKNKVITLNNPLADGSLKLEMSDRDEAVVEVVFAGHRDPTNSATPLYTITETETIASNLTALAVTTATLAPVFAAGTYVYGSSVANATSSVTVTPTLAGATITLRVNGTVVATGVPSAAISLSVGANVITVTVAETAKTNKTYTITIVRQST
jgi:uncharacterized protein YlaN (UPF0358 family)